MSEQVALLLEEAAENIKEYGWVQQTMGSTKKGFCAVGAVEHCPQRYTRGAARAYIHLVDATKSSVLSAWNDKPERTKRQVLAAFAKAAKLARAKA